jgi:hypothetical protein
MPVTCTIVIVGSEQDANLIANKLSDLSTAAPAKQMVSKNSLQYLIKLEIFSTLSKVDMEAQLGTAISSLQQTAPGASVQSRTCMEFSLRTA